jgi:hypothetical protein
MVGILDRTGKTYGYWTAISFYDREKSHTRWLCRCICGTERPVIASSLTKGVSVSCGCIGSKIRSQKTTKHGMAKTTTYKSWHSMHQRCQGKGGHESYVRNGITVCERWYSFENFVEDMGVRPVFMTLDRIDGTKGYYKENCRWATHKQQMNNRNVNVIVEPFGEKMTIAEAADKYKMGISCLRHRLNKGMSINEALTKPVANNRKKGGAA